MRHPATLITALMLSATLAAQAPTLVGTAPAAESVTPAPLASIELTFDQNMAAPQAGELVVIGDSSGEVTGTVSGAGTPTLTFTPGAPLVGGDRVIVSVAATLQSSAGQAIGTAQVFQFLIASIPTTPAWQVNQPLNNASGHTTGDLNGDGHIDIILAEDYGPVHLGDGMGGFAPAYNSCSWTFVTYDVDLADVDKDGDLDAVFAQHQTGIAGNAQNWVAYNDGTGYFTTRSEMADPLWEQYTIRVVFADMNGDGWVDCVQGNGGISNQSTVVNLNDGTGNFPTYSQNSNMELWAAQGGFTDPTWDMVVADADLDGDLDVFCANRSFSASRDYLYNNDGTGYLDTRTRIGSLATITSSISVADFNGDGYPDVIKGNQLSENELWLNPADGTHNMVFTSYLPQMNPAQNVPTRDMIEGDVDGDGDIDVVGGFNGITQCFLNDGAAGFTLGYEFTPWVGDQQEDIDLVDLDGDGDLDVISSLSGTGGSQTHVHLNELINIDLIPGTYNPGTVTTSPGATSVVVHQLTVVTPIDQLLDTITIRASGSGDDANDITQVRIFREAVPLSFQDGAIGHPSAEPAIWTGTYPADDGEIVIPINTLHGPGFHPSYIGQLSWLIVYDFDAGIPTSGNCSHDYNVEVIAATSTATPTFPQGTPSGGATIPSTGGGSICGDCDQNGQVTILDALSAARIASGITQLPGFGGPQFFSCNVQGAKAPDPTATVGILDALSIARYVVGLATLTCCP